MRNPKKVLFVFFSACLLSFQLQAQDETERPFLANVRAAMEAEIRTDAEKARDANRKPIETLDFFGITEDMRVVELLPGLGWYTKLLAPALRENGKLYEAIGTRRLGESGLLDEAPFDEVEILELDAEITRPEGARHSNITPFSLGVDDIDAVLTFRNVHSFDAEGRANMHAAAFEALKPGGIYGVVDHTRRHMEELTNENRRRVDPVQAIKEILDAGFEFEDYSTLHFRADDELRYEVGRRSVTGNTDRFTFLFRKPAE